MKYKIFSELVLIAASILCVFVIGFIIFAGASFIGGIIDSEPKQINGNLNSILFFLSLIFYVIAVIIAWFKRFRFIGSILITIFAVAQLLINYDHALIWLQFSILFIGPLLYIFVYLDKQSSIKEEN